MQTSYALCYMLYSLTEAKHYVTIITIVNIDSNFE